MSGRRPKPTLPPDQLTMVWQSVSLLLDYPDEDLLEQARPAPIRLARPARRRSATRSAAFVDPPRDHAAAGAPGRYVETFDNRRRCNLFLTYFAHGDTRKRGMALLRFKQTYLAAGFELDDAELPDHLCVVLEFAATGDQALGRDLMLDHRAGLELLRLSLRDMGSPWARLVDAVTATLPPLRGDERDAVRRLAAEGPPEEEVGLAPFASPAVQPRRDHAPAPTPPSCRCRPSQEPAHERVPLRRRPLPVPDDLRRRPLWRYRYDKFGWTTRSSQLYENRLLRIGSPLFHFGMLGVVGGHVIGLLMPESWTDAVGISEHTYHVVAVAGGLLAGVMTVVGLAILDLPPPHRRAGVLGHDPHGQGHVRLPRRRHRAGHVEHHRRLDPDHRRRVRLPRGRLGLVPLVPRLPPRPRPDGRGTARASSCTHWSRSGSSRCGPSPASCTSSARPLGYLTRPYIVYRSRDDQQLGSHRPRRGWDRVG